jgi:hypothetical protein
MNHLASVSQTSRPRKESHMNPRRNRFALALLCAGSLMGAGPATALQFDWNGVSAALNNTLSAGAAWRLEDRAPDLVGIANGGSAFYVNADDGNLAFDQGDMVSAAAKLTSDLTLNWGDYGLFTRGSAVYNPVLENKQLFDAADYLPNAHKEFTLAERAGKTRDVRDHDGHKLTLLDAYVFGTHSFGDRTIALHLGKQALNWGEALLIQNGINSILSFDANRLHTPGMNLEEAILPVSQAWTSVDVIAHVTAEIFYQFDWQRTIPDAAGTFLSTNDVVPIGGTQANIDFGRAGENSDASAPCMAPPLDGLQCVPYGGTVPRGADREPHNRGQYGVALRTMVPALNEMGLSVYAMNYHSRLPVVSATSRASGGLTPASTGNYFIEYPEDIQLYGLSFNTSLPFGGIAMQGEYSYKHDQPLQVDDVELLLATLGAPSQFNSAPGATLGQQYIQGWRRNNMSQIDVSFTKLFGPTSWLGNDDLAVFAEFGADYVHDLPPRSELRYDGPGTDLPGDAATAASQGLPQQVAGYPTRFSWGYRLVSRFTYNNVFNLFQMEPTLHFEHDVTGITPTPISNFVQGRRAIVASLITRVGSNWSTELGYSHFFGGGAQNLLRDRDYADLSIKYSF